MKARIQRLVERAEKTLPAQVVMAYGQSHASNYALALAFAGFMSMFPIMLGALAILGLAIRDPSTQAHIQSLLLQAFPPSAQPELEKAMNGVKQSAGLLGLVSFVGLLWGASSIFGTMEFALTQIFGTRQRDILRQRAMGLVMMLMLVAALVASVGITSVAAFFPLASWATWAIGFFAGAIVMVGLLCGLYRFVPNRSFRLRDVLPGALLAGVLIELLTLVFPLYAKIAGSINTYGAQFGLFFVLATWFYLLSQLVLLGAVYNHFRLGEPARPGLVASPRSRPREKDKPVNASEKKRNVEAAEPQPPRRSVFQRAALAIVVAVAIGAGAARRKKPKTAN